ncbi:hypothetical protein KKG90_01585 [Candidatus Bipolaricaulota bacterium]|nr:hypothetical protein [Candidatus Bipolaricaulota bacterium]
MAIVVLAVSGFAVQRSVTIRTSWKVLPYQTLQLNDSRDETTAVAFDVPEPTALDIARGYIESEHAVRLHVVSNTPWKIQVWVRNRSVEPTTVLQVRRHGGNYLELSGQPQILVQGLNGVFEISVDYRLQLEFDGTFATDPSAEIVYTIMSD